MGEGYVLEWLDTLVTVTLNPAKSKVDMITSSDIAKIEDQLIVQKDKIQTAIKSSVFSLNDEMKIRCLIKTYHSNLTTLLEQALDDLATIKGDSPLSRLLNTTIVYIEEVLYLIEHRFEGYLSIDERVPSTYLKILRKELTKRIAAVDKVMHGHETYLPTFKILRQDLEKFLTPSPNKRPYTFQEIFYLKDLCLELEHLQPVEETTVYSRLDGLLISMNFNSKTYVSDLTNRFTASVNQLDYPADKVDRLLFYLKIFKQYPVKPGLIFNRNDVDLQRQVINWITQELSYLENQIQDCTVPLKDATAPKGVIQKEKPKLLSAFSVDQMALILRAADELKIIMARSLNSVFKTIVPFLSTPYQENISYDSMRSKSYAAEIRDKEIVIEALQQMIKTIGDY